MLLSLPFFWLRLWRSVTRNPVFLAALRGKAATAEAALASSLTALWELLLDSASAAERPILRRVQRQHTPPPSPLYTLLEVSENEDAFIRSLALAELAGAELHAHEGDVTRRIALATLEVARLGDLHAQMAQAEAAEVNCIQIHSIHILRRSAKISLA
ncbi:hypothetical protein T492DRAFT_445647 [Pavlovales sp. CCMP2436]|nr:hypothetical protein T492DRAFT_445647 [Pavlovales sp. CCMP2436]